MAQIWLPAGPQAPKADPPWPTFPQSPPTTQAYTVRFSDIDLAKHMNNAAYVEALDDAAWEAYNQLGISPETLRGTILEYDIEYLESARLGRG